MEEQFKGVTSPKILSVSRIGDVAEGPLAVSGLPPLRWGRDHIGLGLLRALRERRQIEFTDQPSPTDYVPPKWDHLVVCERGEDLSEVIAANYAYALRAGLHLFPAIGEEISERVSNTFATLNDDSARLRSEELQRQGELRSLCGPLPLEGVRSITFITRSLPLGFAFPEVPSTHLFSYPDLGLSVANGFAGEQPQREPTGVAAIVDPGAVPAPEIRLATNNLARRGMYVRAYHGPNATVREVSELIELFPYDLLLIATHCGDASGYRWTYEYTDSEGHERRLVVDIALGIARTDDDDQFHVTQFTRFVSLDGVPWDDPMKKERLYVGTAMNDYVERRRAGTLEPVIREGIDRVRWSAALRMYDNNYIAVEHLIADAGSPIIINNACGSWHRLAGTFTFAGARTYIGTLFPVMGIEAEEVTKDLLGGGFGKALPVALWDAQCRVYPESFRRPYVVVGAFPQRLHRPSSGIPHRVARRLARGLRWWQRRRRMLTGESGYKRARMEQTIAFYERELTSILKIWPKARAALSSRLSDR
jgi:hypothetical protein